MTEIQALFKELLVGNGSVKEIGIRLLIFLVGTLTSIVAYYVKRDINKYGEDLAHFGARLRSMDDSLDSMNETFSEYKNRISELMLKNIETMRSESHALRVGMVNLEGKLTQTELHLNQSHETREDVYGLLKMISEVEKQHQAMFGRVILLEEITSRYDPVLSGLLRLIRAREAKKKG